MACLALNMPKPDKKDASNGLILGHEVLQKCCNVFQVDCGHGLDSKIKLEEGLIPTYHWVPGCNFCYSQDILMIFVPNWSALNSAIFIHWYMHYITTSTTEKKIFKIQVCLFCRCISHGFHFQSAQCGPCYNITFHSFSHLHAQNFIAFKMSDNLLNFDRKYVS